jgi:hypothetical protein
LAKYASVLPIWPADLGSEERREGFQRVEREQAPCPADQVQAGP